MTNPRDRDVKPTAFDPFDHRLEDLRNIRLGIVPKAWREEPLGWAGPELGTMDGSSNCSGRRTL